MWLSEVRASLLPWQRLIAHRLWLTVGAAGEKQCEAASGLRRKSSRLVAMSALHCHPESGRGRGGHTLSAILPLPKIAITGQDSF